MTLELLKDLWDEDEAAGMDEPELLRYRSNLLGRDLRLTNFGGGNTSAKIPMTDPVTGETVTVLWVKGSGGDLGTMKRDGLATLYLDKLNSLKAQYRGVDEEDAMADKYALCTFNNNPRASSIDTPLHGFLPYRHVDHLHPDWAIALAACANGPDQLTKLHEATGIKLVWLPWKRPGFELGLWLENADRDNPGADGIILGSHGIFTWGETSRESYLQTLRVIDGIGQYVTKAIAAKGDGIFGGAKTKTLEHRRELAAALMPVLRGEVGPALGSFTDNADTIQFVNSHHAADLAYQGTSCPDHFVRTKVRPMLIEWDAANGTAETLIAAARTALAVYRKDYADYYETNKLPDSPAMRSANPTVALVPGVGMFSFGRNKAESRITGEFYVNAIHVMEGATALSDNQSGGELLEPFIEKYAPTMQRPVVYNNYTALPLRESFNIEYWSLEEAKLKRMPPEKELSRKVALIVGAGPGIGLEVANRLAREGAHVALIDLNPDVARATTETVQSRFGKEIAISGSADCTDRNAVQQALRDVTLQLGGVDILVQVAAVFIPPDAATAKNTDAQWRKSFEINVVGSYIAADEAQKIMTAQETNGSIVLIGSANAVVAKKGSLAYDTSKAAVNHLIREMAVEFAPKVRVNGVAPASVVEGSQMFPRDRVITSLAKYAIAFEESESTEELRGKLADFYASRTLLKRAVTPKGVAEAAFLLASDTRTGLMTGQVLAVDAGLPEAFLR